MTFRASFVSSRCRTGRLSYSLVVLVAILPSATSCTAQESHDEDVALTLHVYTALIQLPVVILRPSLDGALKVDPKKLTVALGEGQPFYPTNVRPEGDDPVSLAILLDASIQPNSLPHFGDMLARLASRSLHPSDSVAIYSLDCVLKRPFNYAPADSERLRSPGNLAVTLATSPARKGSRECGDSLRFRDSLIVITKELSQQPGRPVLLAISSGRDNGSTASDEDVHRFANRHGVAIFGLSQVKSSTQAEGAMQAAPRRPGFSAPAYDSTYIPPPDPIFSALSESTGGLVRSVPDDTMNEALETFVKTIRERFIVEFPRPKNVQPETEAIHISIAKTPAFIRTVGISVPSSDPRIPVDSKTPRLENRASESHSQ